MDSLGLSQNQQGLFNSSPKLDLAKERLQVLPLFHYVRTVSRSDYLRLHLFAVPELVASCISSQVPCNLVQSAGHVERSMESVETAWNPRISRNSH